MKLRSINQGIGFIVRIEILRKICTGHLHDLWVFLCVHSFIHIIRFRAVYPVRPALKSDSGEGLSPTMAFDLSFELFLSKSQEQKRGPCSFLLCFVVLSFFFSFSTF